MVRTASFWASPSSLPPPVRVARSGSEAAKEVKSCSPTRWGAACCSGQLPGALIRIRFGKDPVLVGLPQNAMASVEARGHRLYAEDANAQGQRAVQRAVKVRRGNGRGQREAGNLRQRMDAGVCAPRPLWEHRLPGNVRNGLCQRALNRWKMRLDLPAVKGRAVVGKDGLPVLHGLFGR